MDFKIEMHKLYSRIFQIGNLVLWLLWRFLHFTVSIWYLAVGIRNTIESYVISCGLLKNYKAIDIEKVKYLAIVIESEEAYRTSQVVELLWWLKALGVKRLCVYDADGVLKKSKQYIVEKLSNGTPFKGANGNDTLLDNDDIVLEFTSFADGKDAVAKAANFIFLKYLKFNNSSEDQKEKIFTVAKMTEALGAIGCGGTEPDLLLVYGPARCHLGFPAWRLPYTEITYGTIKVNEIWFPDKNYLQLHTGAPELWYMNPTSSSIALMQRYWLTGLLQFRNLIPS